MFLHGRPKLFVMRTYDFKKVLLKSQEAVEFMGEYFTSKGYNVHIPELIIAPEYYGAFSKYSDQGDMFIEKDGVETKVEIKHITTDFTYEWPYKDIIVNSYVGYESKVVKPDVHILLNKDKTYYLSIRNETFPTWEVRRIYDKVKDKELLFYFASKECAKFFKI